MTYRPNSPPDIDAVTAALDELPKTSPSQATETRVAQAALFHVRQTNSNLADAIRGQISETHAHYVARLQEYVGPDGNYVLPPVVLRGIVAGAVNAGAIQTAQTIGDTLGEVHNLQTLFDTQDTGEAGAA